LLPVGQFQGMTPKFCLIDVKIVEAVKNGSKIIQKIDEFSKSKRHFDYRNVVRGICISKCIKVHEELGVDFKKYEKEEKKENPNPNDPEKMAGELFNKLNNICVNKELYDKYGILATTSIKYCVGGRSYVQRSYDFYDYGFIGFVSVILFMNILSTITIKNEVVPWFFTLKNIGILFFSKYRPFSKIDVFF
jgi:hypothetical protein